MANVEPKKLHGKTIEWIDHSSCNCWTFHFTDGSRAVIDTEVQVSTQYGNISGPEIVELTEPYTPC